MDSVWAGGLPSRSLPRELAVELLTLISGCEGMGVLVKISLGTPHLLFLNKFWTESGIYVSRSFCIPSKAKSAQGRGKKCKAEET